MLGDDRNFRNFRNKNVEKDMYGRCRSSGFTWDFCEIFVLKIYKKIIYFPFSSTDMSRRSLELVLDFLIPNMFLYCVFKFQFSDMVLPDLRKKIKTTIFTKRSILVV